MKKSYFLLLILIVSVFSASAFQNKYPFQVKKTGSGEKAIVFIPGFACSGDVWSGTVEQFSDKHTCYTLTMAGFAGVPAGDSSSFALWEKGIAEFLKENKLEKPVVVGHSMGGGLVMALAADYPELVGSVVIVDALPCLAAMRNPSFKAEPGRDCSAQVRQFTAMSDDAFRQMQQRTIPQLLADSTRQPQVVNWSVTSDRKTFASMYCDFMNTDLRAKIASVRCPTLVLLEAYFANLKPAIQSQYSNLKNADLEYAQKGLHFIMYDDSEWYLQQLHRFIKS